MKIHFYSVLVLAIAVMVIDIEAISSFRKDKKTFRTCVGEQIEVARQNWDTVIPTTRDDAEFVAQDQLRDFIVSVCYE